MKPAPFKYFAPKSVEEALELLTEYGYEAKVIAGGQSLVPTMNFRLAQPSVLIDLNSVSDLFYIHENNSKGLKIGAMTRQRELERNAEIIKQAPLIPQTMPFISHPQIRNRGTIGGSLAHADPSAELPAVMVALDARFCLRSQTGDRWIPAKEFFVDVFTTALEPEELLVEIEIPAISPRTHCAFREVARRKGDFALVGVAAVVNLDDRGYCEDARLVFLSVGNGPVKANQAVQLLVGGKPTAKIIQEAAKVAAMKDIDPPGDIHASADYRRHLAKVLTEQVLTTAFYGYQVSSENNV